ncbi:MAG TPA: DEAD/DEAH box helicase family protein, partial [Actinopolymorphaceae bacterium]
MGRGFARCRFDGEFRTHQAEALAAFDRVTRRDADGDRPQGDGDRSRGDRAYLVLPPGAGKTLVGLEAARRLGRPTLVLGPNTAIQAQWLRTWERFTPRTVTATSDRAMPTPLTVLTYQAVAVFDPDAEVDEDGRRRRRRPRPGDLLARLHENGRALVERMRAGGPWTLVLDECHHLLEVWGRLLVDLIEYVEAGDADRVAVVGLTATPRTTLTPSQAALVTRLFGDLTSAVSTPALVRTGHVAPYQELAYITTPTAEESDDIRSEAERFVELRTDLLDPRFGSTSFLQW